VSNALIFEMHDGLNYFAGSRTMEERRRTPRQRVLKAGTISFGGASIDCTIRNLTSLGASLNVASPIGIPDKFVLVLQSDQSTRACIVVWRKEKQIGVSFC
jgi:hypothetical protein